MDKNLFKSEFFRRAEQHARSKYPFGNPQGFEHLTAIAKRVESSQQYANECVDIYNDVLVDLKVDLNNKEIKEEATEFLKSLIPTVIDKYLVE